MVGAIMAEIIQSPKDGSNIEDITKKCQQICNFLNKLVSNVPTDSIASDVAGIVSDFNNLLAELRALNGR